nr:EOG090X03P9 [Lepidurus arcticus]
MDNTKYRDCREAYNIRELIGKGGFASVHRAVCIDNGAIVAIKMIDKGLMQAAGMVSRVKQEVSIHSRLKHPSILELYTYFEDQDYVYLVLEHCENGELQKYIKTLGKGLSESEARHVMIQVVEGMLYLHSHNILHRDLSLANLLLTKDMRVKIADFGLATQLSRSDEKHLTMCGTPNYISPEVAMRSSHGLEADVWGLGCLLYTMLVGKPPFDTDGVKATLTRVVMADFKLPDYLSPEAKDLIKQCLKKNPKERIKLQNILSHPFILQSTHTNSQDSGLGLASLSENPSFKSYPCQGCSHFGDCTCHGRAVRDNQPENLRGSGHVLTETAAQAGVQNSQPLFKQPTLRESQKLASLTSPLNTERLRPTRQKTKNAIASILDDGEVCLEFVRVKEGVERIMDVCRISSDGMRIILYEPGDGRGVVATDAPPPLPSCGADAMYGFENLPSQHFKKYLYAERFVSLVKAKTPKITLYGSHAKFLLMENGRNADAEACFYAGGKIAYSQGKFSSIENGRVTNFSPGEITSAQFREQWNRFDQYWKHCLQLEEILASVNSENRTYLPCFPIIVGRRPSSLRKALENKENRSENRSPEPNLFISKLNSFENSALQSRNSTRLRDASPTTRSVDVPGIGKAYQKANGEVEVNFFDGSYLKVSTESDGVIFKKSNMSSCVHYSSTQPFPSDIKNKLALVPKAVEYLVRAGIGVGLTSQKVGTGLR